MNDAEAGEWLDRCKEILVGEGGYVSIAGKGYEFDPAPLRSHVPTSTLETLLMTADRINECEGCRYILSEGYSYQSILAHINRRAVSGDTRAAEILEQRMRRILEND